MARPRSDDRPPFDWRPWSYLWAALVVVYLLAFGVPILLCRLFSP